jgi:hypothetical protein
MPPGLRLPSAFSGRRRPKLQQQLEPAPLEGNLEIGGKVAPIREHASYSDATHQPCHFSITPPHLQAYIKTSFTLGVMPFHARGDCLRA